MKSSLTDHPPLRLITAKSKSFPEGNGEAFHALESELETLKGRKFYGLLYAFEDRMEYHAGFVPNDKTEETRFAERGYPIIEIEAGSCARTKLKFWKERLDHIGPIFVAMMGEYEFDSARPQIEYYRSETELQLLLSVKLNSAASGR